MTDNEIIKALECCANEQRCDNCPLFTSDSCFVVEEKAIYDLINRQKAEIERLEGILDKRCDVCPAATSAIREYTKFLIDKSNSGVIFAMDLCDYIQEFLDKRGGSNGN